MLKRIYLLFTVFMTLSFVMHAQVTTSSIAGTVKNTAGQTLDGATVTAIHTPSGTTYTTVSGRDGVFTLLNLRIGGPYTLRVTYAGQEPFVVEGINLQLGEPYNVNAVLGEAAALETVVVTGRSARVAPDKVGAATNIGNREISTLPTINRSITDFTRVSPQANGTSFAGRDARYNNVQIDGANFNNNFGLSSAPLPGGGNPISLDAIDQITVNVAPFDVRQANFTGAGISAVTKSGTNVFHGTAYGYYRDESFNGTKVAGTKLGPQTPEKNSTIGATLGGPIIRNKLFFFLNAEFEKQTYPGITWSPAGGSGSGNVSAVSIDSLRKFSDFLSSQYGYETGAYDNFPNFSRKNHKLLGKIDWNISTAHKLTLKYSDYVSNNDVSLNSFSIPNGAGSTFRSVARFGPQAMAFANSNYGFEDAVKSGTLELNSRFQQKFGNQFIATYTKVNDTRTSPSAEFPFIDILGATGNNYMSAGFEPYSHNNDVINNIFTVTDNFSYYTGKHAITAGASYEYQKVGNMFMPASQSYYVFNSLNDFVTNQAPKAFALTYSLIPGEDAIYSAELKIGQLGVYLQDEITVNDRLKITGGLRIDKPIYPEQPLENPAISALSLYADPSGSATTHYTTGAWPKAGIYWSPRAGFRLDAKGDKSLVFRGGSGLFTGRIPFVYLTNVPTNSAMYQYGMVITNPTTLQDFKFNPDTRAYNPFYNTSLQTTYPNLFPITAGTAVPTGPYALTTSNFRFPQVWRSNLAVDKQIAPSWSVSLEALYTKDVNAVYMFNANQKPADGTVTTGSYTRPRWSSSSVRKLNSTSGNAVVLDNTNMGNSFAFTAMISKAYTRGFYGSLAYTFTSAKDVTANPGSQANSVWSVNPTSKSQNDLELAPSLFGVPHRVMATLSYRFEYINHLATTLSLFYEGANLNRYSYTYNGDLNNDGNFADLMYIPRDASEIQFKDNVKIGSNTYTAQQQSDMFFKYLEQDPYLSKHKGEVAERNGALLPWYNRVDFKFAQDIFTTLGGRRNTLQFTADVVNFLNMLNSNWGVRQFVTTVSPLKVESVSNGVPTFSLNAYQSEPVQNTFEQTMSTSTTWGLQLGLRYSF
ncbi:MAG: TonB-dependent receptor [Flavisolibacter sp.]